MSGGGKMTIDIILKTIRKELNISQETFARELNVSYATLNRWENKKAKPSRLAMEKLIHFCSDKGIAKNIIESLKKL